MASPEGIQQFEMIVNSLMSQDNALRGQAEQAFNAAKANPDAMMSALVHLLRNNQNEAVRTLVLDRSMGRRAALHALQRHEQRPCSITLNPCHCLHLCMHRGVRCC